jgi:hypothetical protein
MAAMIYTEQQLCRMHATILAQVRRDHPGEPLPTAAPYPIFLSYVNELAAVRQPRGERQENNTTLDATALAGIPAT